MSEHLLIMLAMLLILKSLFVGSDFSFHHWLRYRKKYTNWYFSRETWEDYINKR